MDTTVHIGTVISGTLRNEDLLDAFAAELERLNPEYFNSPDMRRVVLHDSDGERASGMIEWLIDALNEYAPPHVYFGAHEGDGADFGWWPIDESSSWCELIQLDTENAICVEHQVHIHVNDHGNVTVSELRGPEIWSAV